MNKHEAIHALQKIYLLLYKSSGPSGAEFDECKKLTQDLGNYINSIPEKEEVTDGDSNPTQHTN